MPDPIAKKRVKKKMLDRWENEGGRIAADTTRAEATRPASENKAHGKKLTALRDESTVEEPTSPIHRRKPTRK